MKLLKSSIIILLASFTFSSCSSDDDSDEFWDAINVSSQFKPVVFVFSSTEIASCDQHGQANLEYLLASNIQNIDGKDVNGMMLFPSITDPLYNPVAEELKFLYDENGSQSFKSFPSFVHNMSFFDIDTLSWHSSIESNLSTTPLISLGQKNSLKNDQQTIYIKGKYNKHVNSSHSIALYLFRKSRTANQKTTTGSSISKSHKNVIYSAVTNSYGQILPAKNKSEELHAKFQFDLSGIPSNEVGYLAVVYKLNDGKPVEVINSLKF